MKVYMKVILAFFVFGVMIAFSFWLFKPRGETLENWTITSQGVKEEFHLPKIIEVPLSQVYSFETTFNQTNNDVLVIPRINGYALKVYINDEIVYEKGDFKEPTANIWNYVHMINISSVKKQEINKVRIDVYALHDVGMIQLPYLTKQSSVQFYVVLQNGFSNSTNFMVMGASLSFAILLLLFSARSQSNKRVYLYYGSALVLFSVYCTDFTYRESTGSLITYLMLRKIQMISIYLAISFMIFAVREYFGNKKTHPMVFIFVLIILYPIAFASDFVVLNRILKITNLIIPLGIIYMIVFNLKDRYKRIIFSSVFMCLVVLYTIIELLLQTPNIFFIQYAVFIYLTGVAFVIAADYSRIEEERKKLDNKSKYDSLTQVLNRYALEEFKFTHEDYLVFIDIDDFKIYNDTYGHHEGDVVLIKISTAIKDSLGANDNLFRYGGDEFIISIKGQSLQQVIEKAELIRQKIVETHHVDYSYGVYQFHNNLLDSLIEADHKMYEMKQSKKREKK